MRYASVALTVSFAVGIVLFRCFGTPVWETAALAATAALLVGALARQGFPRLLLLVLGVCAAGAWRASIEPSIDRELALRVAAVCEVTGTVVSYPSLGPRGVRFVVRPDHLPGALLVTWRVAGPHAGRIRYGDIVHVTGRAQIPGMIDAFDYGAYLARQGILATFTATQEEGVAIVGAVTGLRRAGDRIRQHCLAVLESRLSENTFALAQSLLFGDRYALSREVQDAFAETGLTHVLAVSGMHLAILLAGFWLALRRLGVRGPLAYGVLSAVVLGCAWIIGPWISLLRAVLLFLAMALGRVLADAGAILRRSVRPMNALAVAAFLLLVVRPSDALDLGLGLSVLATAGLIAFPAARWKAAKRRPAWVWRVAFAVRSVLLASMAAQAGAAPLLALQLERLFPWSALSSLCAVPAAAIGLWFGLAALAFLPVPALGWVAGRAFALSLAMLERTARAWATVPGAALVIDRRSGLWMGGAVVFCLAARHVVGRTGWVGTAGGDGMPSSRRREWRLQLPRRSLRLTRRVRGPRLLRHAEHGERLPDRTELRPAAHAQAREALAGDLRVVSGDMGRTVEPSLRGFWVFRAGRSDRLGP